MNRYSLLIGEKEDTGLLESIKDLPIHKPAEYFYWCDNCKRTLKMGRALGEVLPAKLQILKALYGINNTWMDVTTIAHNHVEDDEKIVLVIDNHVFGRDPAPNIKKKLRVDYIFNGKRLTKEFEEGETLII